MDNGDSKTIITTDTIQGFCDENNIGYTIFNQTYTSSTNEPQARILMERTFDGTKTGTVSIQDLFVSVSVYGNSQLRGATAKLKISVVSGAANTTTIIKQEEIFVSAFNSSSTDYIMLEAYTKTFANIKSFKIELEEESSTYSGSIEVRFSCYVGVAGNSRTCVLARDGMMLSSGTGDRFFIRPTDNSMAIVADIPIISSPDDVKSLEIGQLFTDSTGIVRRYSRDDAQNESYYERKLVKVSGGNEKLDLSDYRTTEVSAFKAKKISGELIYDDIKDYDEASIGALYKYGGTSTYDNIRRKIK